MSAGLLGLAVALLLYVTLLLVVGGLATRRAGGSPEEYFLAGRRLGTLVLFMALFGTNATAFVLVGVPGRSYVQGIGFFGVNAAIVALFTPLTFYLVGAPARRMAERLGALSPAELYAKRFASPTLGVLLFLFFTVYTVPYMVSAIVGSAVTLETATGGVVPRWAGGFGVVVVALVYTTLGGMRATAWTNVLQGTIFLGFLLVAFVVIAVDLGGPAAAMQAVETQDPELLRVDRSEGPFEPRRWLSWGLLMSLTVIAFPHMFARLMAAGSEQAIKGVCRLYPIALLALWLPPVMIGVWGAAVFPGLDDPDEIFQLMVGSRLPAAFSVVAVLAAVMSSLDAMILTLSSMLVRDVIDRVQPARGRHADVVAGRLFSVVVAVVAWALALIPGRSIVDIAAFGFAGYVMATPLLYLGVRWRRFTKQGAMASLLAGNAVLLALTLGDTNLLGFLPVFWGFLTAVVTGVGVSLMTTPDDESRTATAFGRRRAA